MTDAARKALLAAGVLPEVLAAAEQAAAKAQQALPTALDVLRDSTVTEADIALARRMWLYTDAVPAEYKRLLSAVEAI